MEVIEYVVLYHDGANTTTINCKASSLMSIIQELLDKYENKVSIFIQPKSSKATREELQKCYKSKYISLSNRYKKGKLDKEHFENAVNKLKELKAESTTKAEFETKYNEYKKNTNNIP